MTRPGQKLDKAQVEQIREKYARSPYVNMEQLSDQYHVDPTTISAIVRGKTWPDVDGPTFDARGKSYSRTSDAYASKLDAEDAKYIRFRHLIHGVSEDTIAEEYDISKRHVQQIVSGEQWAEAGGPTKDKDRQLKESDVMSIRYAYDEDEYSVEELSELYDVSEGHVYNIIYGKTWSNAPGPTISKQERTSHKKLEEKDVRHIKRSYRNEEETLKSLGSTYNVHPSTISSIVNGRTWSDVTLDDER